MQVVQGASGDQLQLVANLLKAKKFVGVAVLFGKSEEQIHVLAMVGPSLTKTLHAGKIVQELTGILGGKGGGRPDMARGVGKDETKLNLAVQRARELTTA